MRRISTLASAFALCFLFLGSGVGVQAAGSHQAIRHSALIKVKHSTSSNWSGYANTGGTFKVVKGSWTQPKATCKAGQTAYAAFWVGIDGDTTNSVEQIGTDSDCASGKPKYYAWYEMYPKYPVNLSKPVVPGDSLSASVSTNGSGNFTLTISDSTRNWTFTTNQVLKSAKLGSAEWIAEAPSSLFGVLPLANFGKVTFTGCTANGLSISKNPNPDPITMVGKGGIKKAAPSALDPTGTSFTVTWYHS